MHNGMRGNGMFGDDCHPRTCTRQNSVNRFKKTENLDNVVIIDLDDDSVHDVIIVDVPESFQKKLQGPCSQRKGSKVPYDKIIRIDGDDDEEDEDNDVDHIEFSETGSKNLGGDRESIKKPSSSAKGFGNPADPDTHEYPVREEYFTSKVSKGEASCSSKLPSQKRYGFLDSESSLSDSDCSDCELLEGSSGKLHEQWEKASLRRKHEMSNDRSVQGNQASTSGLHAGAYTNVPVDNRDSFYRGEHIGSNHRLNDQSGGENLASNSGLHDGANADVGRENKEAFFKEDPAYSCSTYEKFKSAEFMSGDCNVQVKEDTRKGKNATHVNYCSSDKANNAANLNEEGGPESTYSWFNMGRRYKWGSFTHDWSKDSDKANNAANLNEEGGPESTYSWFNMGRRYKWGSFTHDWSKDEQQKNVKEPFSYIPQAMSINDEGSASSESQDSGAPGMLDERVVQMNDVVMSEEVLCDDNYNKLHEGASDIHQEAFGKSKMCRASGSTDTENGPGVCVKDVTDKSASSGHFEEGHVEACSLEKADGYLSKPCLKDDEAFVKSAPNIQTKQKEQSNAEGGDCMPILHNSIINGREKMKETDEYKRAQEEEWASRQRQLQIQAEEAQKLRKRKKAEHMRLLDMERRQKQRVEEVRQTQKKDEEDMNLKEQFRAEIRKELSRLEITCIDMASLLRGLGIQVGSSLHPPPSREVHAAYKRALLRFHPDRASRNDIRQQVEAEEKFKLISRMKDKFLRS